MHKSKFMEKLLDGVEVEWKKLGDIGQVIRGNGMQKKDFVENGFPAVHYGQIYTKYNLSADKTFTFVSNELAKKLKIANNNDLLIATTSENDEDLLKSIAWLGKEVAISGDMMFFRHNENVKYLAYYFQTTMFQKQKMKYITGAKVKRISKDNLEKFQIPIPPLEIQSKIVQILDNFTELTAELTARKKEYSYYRDKLLTFKDNEVEWKKLGEILIRTRGTKITAGEMKELHKDNAPIKIFAGGKTVAFIDFSDIPQKDINTKPSIIVKSRGVIEFEYYDKPFSHKNEMWSYYSDDENIDIKFIYYFLKMNEPYFQRIASRMQMPQISILDTDNFKIPIPSIEKQKEIVEILDKFDTLTNSISEGLPKEIELRQKQYEYYRDMLLSFPKDNNE